MKAETHEMMKDNLVRINEASQYIRGKMGLTWWKRNLINLYFASPRKIQLLLARLGVRKLVNEKKSQT